MIFSNPLGVPYMEEAFGGGGLTNRDAKGMLSGSWGGAISPMMGGLGLGSAQPAQMAQAPAPIQHNGPQQGPTLLKKAISAGMGGGGGGGK